MKGNKLKEPELLGTVLKKLFKRYDLSDGIQQQDALELWKEVAGEKIAGISTAVSIEHGRIFVEVDNNVWRQEIQFQKKDFIKRFNEKLGNNSIKDIILV